MKHSSGSTIEYMFSSEINVTINLKKNKILYMESTKFSQYRTPNFIHVNFAPHFKSWLQCIQLNLL